MITVYFDGDQTLWDFQALMRRTLAATIDELIVKHGPVHGDLSVASFVADREAVARELAGRVTNLEQIRLEAFRRSLARLAIDDPGAVLAQHLNQYYLQRRWAGVDLFDDAVPTLQALNAMGDRVQVGLLSNGNSYPDRNGLGSYFAATVFSQDIGVEKPDPRIYQAAARRLPGDRYVMVGDSVKNDVIGAQDAGWLGVWLNREAAQVPAGAAPDRTVTTLTQTITYLSGLGA